MRQEPGRAQMSMYPRAGVTGGMGMNGKMSVTDSKGPNGRVGTNGRTFASDSEGTNGRTFVSDSLGTANGWKEVETEEYVPNMPPGSMTRAVCDGTPIIICKLSDGCFGLEDRCSHERTPLSDGELIDSVIECPKHGARFDVRTGAVLALPAVKPVVAYDVKLEDDRVYVQKRVARGRP